MKIDVRVDLKEIEFKLAKMRDSTIRPAAARALNRAAEAVRTDAGREVRKLYTVKARAVRAQMVIRRASAAELTAVVVPSGKRISLDEFQVRTSRSGSVSVKVKRNGKGGVIPHAFIIKGRRGIWLRVVPGTERTTQQFRQRRIRKTGSDLPIAFLRGPSFPQMLIDRSIRQALVGRARDVFRRNFEHELQRRVRG